MVESIETPRNTCINIDYVNNRIKKMVSGKATNVTYVVVEGSSHKKKTRRMHRNKGVHAHELGLTYKQLEIMSINKYKTRYILLVLTGPQKEGKNKKTRWEEFKEIMGNL